MVGEWYRFSVSVVFWTVRPAPHWNEVGTDSELRRIAGPGETPRTRAPN